MKKRINAVLLFFLMLLMVGCVTVSAKNGGVYDDYGILSPEQYQDLTEKLNTLQELYPIEGAIAITDQVYGEVRHYAAELMQDNEIGYGDSLDGFCFLQNPVERDIAIVFRGNLQYYFKSNITDTILDDVAGKLQQNDYYGAYVVVIDEVTNCMNRVIQGKEIRPMDIRGEGLIPFAGFSLVLSFIVMAIPTLIMTLVQKGKMNMIVPQPNADCYIPKDGFRLRRKTDRFVRNSVSRTAKPKDDDKGHSSGSFSSRGESFSGSSRKY